MDDIYDKRRETYISAGLVDHIMLSVVHLNYIIINRQASVEGTRGPRRRGRHGLYKFTYSTDSLLMDQ